MCFPSGENAIEYMRPRWPSTVARRRPVAESQSRSVPSWPQEACVFPSGANASDVTVSSWRSRRVPIRMTEPRGRGSPSRSTGSCARPRASRATRVTTLYLSYGELSCRAIGYWKIVRASPDDHPGGKDQAGDGYSTKRETVSVAPVDAKSYLTVL